MTRPYRSRLAMPSAAAARSRKKQQPPSKKKRAEEDSDSNDEDDENLTGELPPKEDWDAELFLGTLVLG